MEARGTAPRSMPSICQCAYVRSSPVEVSSRWSVSNPRLNESSRVSLAAGRRDVELAQFSDTAVSAPGGLSQRQGAQPKLRSQSQVVVGFCGFPECLTRVSSTWARRTDVTTHVEPSSPPCTRTKASGIRLPVNPCRPQTLLDGPGCKSFLRYLFRQPTSRSFYRRLWPDRAPGRRPGRSRRGTPRSQDSTPPRRTP